MLMKADFLGFYSEHLGLLVKQAREAGVSTEALLESTSRVLGPLVAQDAADGYASGEEGLHALLAAEGGSVSLADAAKLYFPGGGAGRQTLIKQIHRGTLIAVESGHRGYLLPVWQFARSGGLVPGLADALKALREHPYYDPLLPFTFFLTRNPLTKGERPIDALRNGRVEEVLVAAAAEGR